MPSITGKQSSGKSSLGILALLEVDGLRDPVKAIIKRWGNDTLKSYLSEPIGVRTHSLRTLAH